MFNEADQLLTHLSIIDGSMDQSYWLIFKLIKEVELSTALELLESILGSILSWWKGEVDGALDPWSCFV